MDRFVVDAGPFIHLDQINQLKLLKNLPLLFVPSSVISEIKHGYTSSELKAIEQWPNVKVITFTREMSHWIKTVLRKASLHQGESDCLRFALENHPYFVDGRSDRQKHC